jgi:hypothetical protein
MKDGGSREVGDPGERRRNQPLPGIWNLLGIPRPKYGLGMTASWIFTPGGKGQFWGNGNTGASGARSLGRRNELLLSIWNLLGIPRPKYGLGMTASWIFTPGGKGQFLGNGNTGASGARSLGRRNELLLSVWNLLGIPRPKYGLGMTRSRVFAAIVQRPYLGIGSGKEE